MTIGAPSPAATRLMTAACRAVDEYRCTSYDYPAEIRANWHTLATLARELGLGLGWDREQMMLFGLPVVIDPRVPVDTITAAGAARTVSARTVTPKGTNL